MQEKLVPSPSPAQASFVVLASSPANLAKGRKKKAQGQEAAQRTVVECPPEMLPEGEGCSPASKKRKESIEERVDLGIKNLSKARTVADTVPKTKLAGGEPTAPNLTRGSRSKSSDLRK